VEHLVFFQLYSDEQHNAPKNSYLAYLSAWGMGKNNDYIWFKISNFNFSDKDMIEVSIIKCQYLILSQSISWSVL